MKKIVFLACILVLSAVPAWATPAVPDGYPPALETLEGGQSSGMSGGMPEAGKAALPPVALYAGPEIDYISPKTLPLNAQEKKALQLSRDWSRQNIDPVLSGGGKVVYVHGASLPTVVAAPMQVCDVELEQGETVHEIVIGDSARWMVDSGTVGSGAGATAHLFIKPVDAGLESSAIVTTDRRVYHLRLVSQRSGHTPYVGFLYADALRRQNASRQAQTAKEREWGSTLVDGRATDLSALNFNYEVTGKAGWKPERVYDDGRQTFIRLPESSKSGEMPVLLVRKGKQDVLVNYRVKDSAMIVDGLFERIALVIGVGGDQEKVEIIRGRK